MYFIYRHFIKTNLVEVQHHNPNSSNSKTSLCSLRFINSIMIIPNIFQKNKWTYVSSFGPSINYPLIVFTFIVPFYSKVYGIILNELHIPLLNIDTNDEVKRNELLNELQSSIEELNTTLLLTTMGSLLPIEFLIFQKTAFRRKDIKLTIHSHEMCIMNSQLYLPIHQQRLNNIKTYSDD